MEDVFGNRIVFADQDEIKLYAPEMERVLAAIAFFMSDDPQKWLEGAWVSDMSSIGDFNLEDDYIEKISESVGVPVGKDELLWKIAKKIHEKRM